MSLCILLECRNNVVITCRPFAHILDASPYLHTPLSRGFNICHFVKHILSKYYQMKSSQISLSQNRHIPFKDSILAECSLPLVGVICLGG